MKKNTTMVDIAKALDIDVSTVSKALKGHSKISSATKEKVARVAKELNYYPNKMAAALVKGRSNLIGVMVPYTDENFFASAIRGIEEVAKKKDYQIVIFQSNDKTEDEIQNIRAMFAAKVDGILVSHAMETESFEHYQQILDNEIPLILFDRYHDSINTNIVTIDNFKAAYQAVTHLIEQGCKKIVHILGYQSVYIYQQRLRGYKQALSDHHLPFDEKLVLETEMTVSNGRMLTGKVLDAIPNVDAIFTSNDYAAVGAMQELKNRNINIPDEIAIVGFGNEAFTSFVTPTITTIELNSRKMGRIAAQFFFELLNNFDAQEISQIPDKKIVNAGLIVRESSLRRKLSEDN